MRLTQANILHHSPDGPSEVRAIVADLRERAKKSINAKQDLVIFRLACGCGLRRKEICGLNVDDVLVAGPAPTIRIRKAITKGREGKRRARLVPLTWDQGTLADIAEWKAVRLSHGAGPTDPFVCALAKNAFGKRLIETQAAKRWKTAIRCLGPERVRQLSIHSGRHSYCSHALAAGHTLVEVRDAAGHSNVATTEIYLHIVANNKCRDLY